MSKYKISKYKISKYTITLLVYLFSFGNFYSQIETGKKSQKLKNQKIKVQDSIKTSSLQFSYLYGTSFREYQLLDTNFLSVLSTKKKEKAIQTSNFYLELKNPIHTNFAINFGFGYQQYGEKLTGIGDSAISYVTKYSNFVFPLKLTYQTSRKLNYFISSGIQAQMLFAFEKNQSQQIGDKLIETKFKKDTDLRPISLAFCANTGINYSFEKISFYVSADAIKQLNSSYLKQKAYSHKPYFLGFRIGFGIHL